MKIALYSRRAYACAAALGIVSISAPAAFATDFPELKRLEPVPVTEQIPIIDFARPALFTNVQLNYSGTYVGALVPTGENDRTALVTVDLVHKTMDGINAPSGDRDISYFAWLDKANITYIVSQKKLAGMNLVYGTAGNLSVSEATDSSNDPSNSLQPDERNSFIRILGTPPSDRSELIVDRTGGELRYDHPETISPENHGSVVVRYAELKTDHGFDLNFWTDKKGTLKFGITQQDGILNLSTLEGETWTRCPEDLDQITVEASGDDDGEVVVLGPRDGKAPRPLEFMDAVSGRPGDVIVQDRSYDFDGWLFRDPKSQNIVGAIYDRAAPHVVWFTQEYRELQKLVDGLFPNQVVRILGMDDNGSMVLISNGSDRVPVAYSWVNLGSHKSELIKNSAPWIDPKRMRPMGIIKYTTAEGRKIDAYITLPAGATKANPPPAVVLQNYSSSSRWTWDFNPLVQFLASRGYAVLQPNHRGNDGYSWMYPETEDWDFRAMSDDVVAATKEAADLGLIDKNRVAVMGTGFGGYLSAEAAALHPGVYKCVIAQSSFYDWGRYLSANNYFKYSDPTYALYMRKLGNPKTESAKFDAMSPIVHARDIHGAVLVSWGEYDAPELISESHSFASAAQDGGHVETLSYLDEGGGLHHLAHQIDYYQHVQDFLGKNL